MTLVEIAEQNLKVFVAGQYIVPSGKVVRFVEDMERAKRGTRLYCPEELETLIAPLPIASGGEMQIEVTSETTGAVLRRLVMQGKGRAACRAEFRVGTKCRRRFFRRGKSTGKKTYAVLPHCTRAFLNNANTMTQTAPSVPPCIRTISFICRTCLFCETKPTSGWKNPF